MSVPKVKSICLSLVLCWSAPLNISVAEQRGRSSSEWIWLGQYEGFKDLMPSADYVIAVYSLIDVLKGPPDGRETERIKYKITRNPQTHKVNLTELPQVGSKWIIFIPRIALKQDAGVPYYETCDDADGREEFSPAKLNRVLDQMEQITDLKFKPSTRELLNEEVFKFESGKPRTVPSIWMQK